MTRIRKSSDKSYPASQELEKKSTEQFKNRMVAEADLNRRPKRLMSPLLYH